MLSLILPILAAAILIFAAVLLLRGAAFRPKKREVPTPEPVEVDGDAAVEHLRRLVRLPTVSVLGTNRAVFEEFRETLRELYPALHAVCSPERIGPTGLLFRIPGRRAAEPAVLLGHYDVVPAEESAWEKPPFAGVLEDGVLWGRGTLDMKGQLCAMLEAAEGLVKRGFVPEHDLYLALSGEEETMGPTAALIRDEFVRRGLRPALVLDEGGDILENFFPGANALCALIGIGEKGPLNVELSAQSAGGHAATPAPPTPLYRVARAVTRLEDHPWPLRETPALAALVETMGPYCGFWRRVLLANRHILRPLYHHWLQKQGGTLLAMAHTTFAPTMASGSQMPNVLPQRASAVANLRLLYGDTAESAVARMQSLTRGEAVSVNILSAMDPQPDSLRDGSYETLLRAIAETWPEAVPTPYLMVATTDSRHWRSICDHVYRFSAKEVTREEKATVHGVNERIRIENTPRAVAFYTRLMRRL